MALLLLLQKHGRVTAAQVAEELEVSERTARRDLDALGMAGVPVYSSQGRNGGWELIGGARTDLTGLNAAEARALFLVAGPSSAATPEVKAALRKLMRALPEPFRADAEAASTAVVVDPFGWSGRGAGRGHLDGADYAAPQPPHLTPMQDAVITGVQVQLGYVDRNGKLTERCIHPLGLATKGAIWYVMANTDAGMRTFRIDRITAATLTSHPVVRPPDFDLREAWRLIGDEAQRRWSAVTIRGFAEPWTIPILIGLLGQRVRIGPAEPGGRVPVEIDGPGLPGLAGELAGFGRGLEFTEPSEMQAMLATIGAELMGLYGAG